MLHGKLLLAAHGRAGTDAARGGAPGIDAANREAWRKGRTVRAYRRLKGWTDPGEQAAFEYVAREVRARAILDIGVGAGRTTGLLRELSRQYVGIDYTQAMVDACRQRHRDACILHMDARDLSSFDENRFALAVFSFNGIDAVDLADRQQVLRQVHRVLEPGGLFIVSSHNRLGPGAGERPRLRLEFSRNPLRLGWRLARSAASLVRSLPNHFRLRGLNETHEEWAIMNAGAHDFSIMVMYTTLAEQKRQLRAAGFEIEQVYDNVRGLPVADTDDVRGVWWFHHVARKR